MLCVEDEVGNRNTVGLLWPWTGGSEARHDGFRVLTETSEARNLEMFIVTKLQR